MKEYIFGNNSFGTRVIVNRNEIIIKLSEPYYSAEYKTSILMAESLDKDKLEEIVNDTIKNAKPTWDRYWEID